MRPSKPGEHWPAKVFGYGFYAVGYGAVLVVGFVTHNRWGWPTWAAGLAVFTVPFVAMFSYIVLGAFGLALRDAWWARRLRREAQGRG